MTTEDRKRDAKPESRSAQWPANWFSRSARVLSPRRRADLIEEPIDGEAVLTDPCTGAIHRLNQTALEIWHSCDGVATMREIAGHLADRYGIDADVSLDHVEETVALLAERQCVE